MLKQDLAYYQLSSVHTLTDTSYKGISIYTPGKGQDLVVGVIYRPEGQMLETFKEELMSIVIPMLTKDKRSVIIIRDFTTDLLKLNDHEPTQDFLNITTLSYLAPTINCSTRVTETTATPTDNIFTNFNQEVINPSVTVDDFSDHFCILLWFGNGTPVMKQKKGETHNNKNTLQDSLLRVGLVIE